MSPTAKGSDGEPKKPICDVVVVSYNQRERLLAALASVLRTAPTAHLIVVDNGSADGSAEAAAQEFPDADVVALDENIGFGAAVNRGVARGSSPYILLLNNDARLRPQTLERLVDALEEPGVVAAGPSIHGPHGEVELSIDRTLSLTNETRFRLIELLYRSGRGPLAGVVRRKMSRSRAVRSLSGACMLLLRTAFVDVDGFDERFFLYAEDVDLCLRLRRRGGTMVYVADAAIDHDRGASRATAPEASELHYRRSQIAFYRKHRGLLATTALRAYLALRFVIQRTVARNRRQRRLAGELLRLTLHETGD